MQTDDDQLLSQFLAARDVECPQCQYNVRDLTTGVCPECGERLALRLTLAETRQAALLTGLVGLSCGVGFNGLLLIYFFIEILRFQSRIASQEYRIILLLSIGLFVFAGTTFSWLRRWRTIRRQSPAIRWGLATFCWLLSLFDLLIFSYNVR